MNKIIASIFGLCCTLTVAGQDIYTPVLQQIEQNSITLTALQKQATAHKLGNHTGIAPSNPEVEFSQAWGSPSEMGTRNEFSVSQSFDFPAVYLQKSRLASLQDSSIDFAYRAQRMELLLNVKNLCIEMVYYNALRELYSAQFANARQILQAYEKMQQQGNAGQLEYNKAVLNYTELGNELKRIDLERDRLLNELQQYNGGKAIAFDAKSYPYDPLPADFESWYDEAAQATPSLQLLQSEIAVGHREVSLQRAEWLPKFSLGYIREFSAEECFQGLKVGLDIPLWENRNRVKQAGAAMQAAEMMLDDAQLQHYNRQRMLYGEARLLQENVLRYRAVLTGNDNVELLYTAFTQGEISLLDYLLEMEYYYAAYDKCLQSERDLAFAMAALQAYKL